MTNLLLTPLLWTQLRALRHTLRDSAELSHQETRTAEVVHNFVAAYGPDAVFSQIAGHGVACLFEGTEPGSTVLVRAELDALPHEHADDLLSPGFRAQHRCGHDGHMSIVAGLAAIFGLSRPSRGRVVLLFQPAEETGDGAANVLDDPRISQIMPDYALALHNMPGFPHGSVILREGTMASASVGMELILEGRAAHAAEPEKAICPSDTLAQLLLELPRMAAGESDGPLKMVTVTHTQMGELTYGVTPGYARLCATLRAHTAHGLSELCDDLEERVRNLALGARLNANIAWHDRFPATHNDPALTQLLREICNEREVSLHILDKPLRWSDDFGHFADLCPSLYFGMGIGEDAARLHQPDYSFPDDAISVGVRLLLAMVQKLTVLEPKRPLVECVA